MVKSLKEYLSVGGGYRIGGADSLVPTADLGDGPPKGQGGRDMRGVGLHASAGIKYLIYQTGNVGKTARIVMKNIKDIQTARNWIKDNGHSFDHKGKNFRIYQYKGNPNNIRPNDLIEQTDLTKDQIKKVHKVADELPKKDFRDRYGKKKGDEVRYGTATNMVKKKLGLEKYDSDKTFSGKGTPEQRLQLLKLTTKALKTFPNSPKQKEIQKDINALRKKMGMKFKEELEERKLNISDLNTVERYADKLFAKVGLDVEFTKHFLDRVNDARNGKQITQAELVRLFKQSFSKHKQSFQSLSKGVEAVLNDIKTDINMPFVIQVDNKGELDMVAKTIMRKKNFSTSNRKYTFEDKNPRIPRKSGQKAGSDSHSDLYTDENPKGTIHGLGFTDEKKARESINKIKNSGKTHAHKMQAAIAMSQRAKVASQRAKDPEKKKNLGQAHKVYQSYIDTNKKSKDD